jgi:hypothetical protein
MTTSATKLGFGMVAGCFLVLTGIAGCSAEAPETTGSSKEAVFGCSNVTSACGGTFACVTPVEGKTWGTGPFETYLYENCGMQSGYNYYKHYVSASENLQSYYYFAACPQSVIDYAVCNYGGAPVYAQPAMDWDSGYAGVKWDPCGTCKVSY